MDSMKLPNPAFTMLSFYAGLFSLAFGMAANNGIVAFIGAALLSYFAYRFIVNMRE
jgi:hypothetical protein